MFRYLRLAHGRLSPRHALNKRHLAVASYRFQEAAAAKSDAEPITVEATPLAEAVPEPEFLGSAEKAEFQAETANILKIVAESLYSDANVFIREFISNASDAIEKCRFEEGLDKDYFISVDCDPEAKTITFTDNGIGMTAEDAKKLLGTIAKSGTKSFANDGKVDQETAKNMIGQFGVGFYSSFMVGSKVEVFTKKHGGETGTYWLSEGVGEFTTQQVSNIEDGTRIVIHLKDEYENYSDSNAVKEILETSSSFTRYQIKLNGEDLIMKKPMWTMTQREMDEEKHHEFYQFLTGEAEAKPRWYLHYVTDAPLSIKGMFYIPEGRPSMHEIQKADGLDGDATCQIRLYSRSVLIQKFSTVLPKWLRFVRGVVDCEDLSLNLSRELLQDKALQDRLKQTVTDRVIKWFNDKAKRRPDEYNEFFKDYKMYIVQGLLDQESEMRRGELSNFLRYESSEKPAGELVSLKEYKERMASDQDSIAYIYALSREVAEKSPYYEAFKSKGLEVLLCFDSYDDITLMHLQNYDGKPIKAAEQAMATIEDTQDKSDSAGSDYETIEKFASWATNELGEKVESVSVSSTLSEQPAMVTGEMLGMLRYYQRQAKMSQATNDGSNPQMEMMKMMMQSMKPKLLVNPNHPLVSYAATQYSESPEKAAVVAGHLLDWSMSSAGLLDDHKAMLDRTNDLISTLLDLKPVEKTEAPAAASSEPLTGGMKSPEDLAKSAEEKLQDILKESPEQKLEDMLKK